MELGSREGAVGAEEGGGVCMSKVLIRFDLVVLAFVGGGGKSRCVNGLMGLHY